MTLYVNFGGIHSQQIGGNVYSGNFRVSHVLIWNHFEFTMRLITTYTQPASLNI